MLTCNKKKFIVIAGKWSTNIGNSFFNMGTKYLLMKSVKNAYIDYQSDQPAYWNIFPFRYRKKPKNSLNYTNHIKTDYLVLQGSVLTKQFPHIWENTLSKLIKKGVKLLLIGVGQFDYSEEEVFYCREVLKKNR